jgi:ABC-type transport system involved in cytochrome bd biosynthesis fused ATPase/permease subunit
MALTLFLEIPMTLLVVDREVELTLLDAFTKSKNCFLTFNSPDIYLLDDPTSSLDNKTVKRIMFNLKNGEDFKNKTIVMTTNDTNLLKFADKLIFMSEGLIMFQGTFDDLQNQPQY